MERHSWENSWRHTTTHNHNKTIISSSPSSYIRVYLFNMAYALYSAMESMSTNHIVSPVCDSTSAAGKPYSSYRPVHARWIIFAFFRSRCRHQYFLNGVHEINGNGNGYLLDHIFVFTNPFLQKKRKNEFDSYRTPTSSFLFFNVDMIDPLGMVMENDPFFVNGSLLRCFYHGMNHRFWKIIIVTQISFLLPTWSSLTIVIIIPMLSLYVEYRYHRLSWCLVNTSKSQIERCGSTGTCTKYTLSLSLSRSL